MTEEVGDQLRVSVMVWLAAGVTAVVINTTGLSIHLLNNYTSKYVDTITSTVRSQVLSLPAKRKVAAPIVYAILDKASSEVASVTVIELDGTENIIYKFPTSDWTELLVLSTKYTTTNVRVSIERNLSNSNMYDVRLEVLKY